MTNAVEHPYDLRGRGGQSVQQHIKYMMRRLPWRGLVAMGVALQEQMMDATEHVKRDLVRFFRTYKTPTLSMHVGPLGTHLRGYNGPWKTPCNPRLTNGY